MTALETLDALEHRPWADQSGERENLIEARQINLSCHQGVFQDGFDFGGEDKDAVADGEIQRIDSEMVARQKEPLPFPVVNDKGELTVELVQKLYAVFFVEVQQHFEEDGIEFLNKLNGQ